MNSATVSVAIIFACFDIPAMSELGAWIEVERTGQGESNKKVKKFVSLLFI